MTAAAAQVRSGAVTRAVRASTAGAATIAEGDWLGIDRDEGIVAVDTSIEHVVVGLLANLVDDDAGIVTVLAGEGANDALTARIRAWVAQHHPGLEVEVHAGDQPLYPYLFGVE
jgi:dihydroxyacetone kinase-like predicted kinase